MSVGKAGEDLVAADYARRGFAVLERNYIFSHGRQAGEIDLIVSNERQLVFVEVKTRSNSKFGSGAEAVDAGKQRKLVKTSKLYLQENPQYRDWLVRIDVAVVDVDNHAQPVIIIPNAIEDLD